MTLCRTLSNAKIANVRSEQLGNLIHRFLRAEDEAGFWLAAQELANSGNYPFVEECPEATDAPDEYVLLTFLPSLNSTPIMEIRCNFSAIKRLTY